MGWQQEEGLPWPKRVPGFLVLILECSKYRTPVLGSILGTISVMSQIHDSRFLCAWPCCHFLVFMAVHTTVDCMAAGVVACTTLP
jgi:hypothetical protein